jgi:septum formation topological specificity factor MinE
MQISPAISKISEVKYSRRAAMATADLLEIREEILDYLKRRVNFPTGKLRFALEEFVTFSLLSDFGFFLD